MKKFEHHLLKINSSLFKGIDCEEVQARLNHLGNLGWEVISTTSLTTTGTTTSLLVTLKRELPG